MNPVDANVELSIEVIVEPETGFTACPNAQNFCTGPDPQNLTLGWYCDPQSPANFNECIYNSTLGCIEYTVSSCETLIGVGSICDSQITTSYDPILPSCTAGN